MDYSVKLHVKRFRASTIPGRNFNEEMESDRGRAITSAAVRRLQQKTQVFPLETNAAVRSRLTHSLEVQQVGRYIAKLVIEKLDKKFGLSEIGLNDKIDGFVSAVEIACLLHDIGNPPFGHFGEKAISLWVEREVVPLFDAQFSGVSNIDELKRDLISFEGNAQGLRILHSLQNMNLTYSQLACLLKYTRCAGFDKESVDSDFSYRCKKPGYYISEKALIDDMLNSLSISKGCRYPLAYIMEAADDISYCIADLDDALDKDILSVSALHEAIIDTWTAFKEKETSISHEDYLKELALKAYERSSAEKINKGHAYFLTLRTRLVNDLAEYAASRYVENHEAVFDGSLDESLLDGDDKYHFATETLKTVARSFVFNNVEVENLELKGYAVILGVLNIYSPLLKLSYKDFKELVAHNFHKKFPIETRLYHNLSGKHKETYRISVTSIYERYTSTSDSVSISDQSMEMYYRVRLLIDYVSGMTDHYALREYQELSGMI